VSEQHFPFSPPSECGGHEGARWLSLSRADGRGLRVRGLSPFHFDARRNTVADYLAARHDHELPARDGTALHLDAAHAPIGGEMAWSTMMPRDYAVTGGRQYGASFELECLFGPAT
jgi:hypothetical protein